MSVIESTQYHTIAITVRSDINNGRYVRARGSNTTILDALAEALPNIVANITQFRSVELRVESHDYVDTHEETM